ncbi:DUF3732 domain-containing protein [Herbaspirillum frisingense]|uniref:DUF3732 domain-containing protein n=1 Tax=Herbaspirillum frisingense TaxID=92645 RepID=A0ABU1PBY2_9BURK|nr:DUF3732 domain-containing protein [Herbaspirillum frisingense]MDR6583449.1 hypothetical protein [Herbaspirillum frisingense]
MQIYISKVILWPHGGTHKAQVLNFLPGKINIIHGRSGTGKSSILAIIDFCLGASRCAIPVGLIREKVFWFGLELCIKNERYLVARRSPGKGSSSSELHISPFEEGSSLKTAPNFTHNLHDFKGVINRMAQITNLPISADDDAGFGDARPSYRDLVPFNLLPQHIVANPNTLFFKSDSYQHKEKLKKTLPYALGIVTAEDLLAEREKNRLNKLLEIYLKRQQDRAKAFSSWESEISRLWDEAIELGVIAKGNAGTSADRLEQLTEVNSAFLEGKLEQQLKTPDYAHTNERYKLVKKKEEELQSAVDKHRREIRSYERLSSRATGFAVAVAEEKARIINLDWLQHSLSENQECVVCGNPHADLQPIMTRLASEFQRVTTISDALATNPVVDKELDGLKAALLKLSDELQVTRKERLQLAAIENSAKGSLSRTYVLLGRLQALLMALHTLNKSDDLEEQIQEIKQKISEIDKDRPFSLREAREQSIHEKIGRLIKGYAKNYGLEERGEIRLDKNELTLSFRDGENKKEYLWEVGSGANWMGYHLATFLALHEYLCLERGANNPVFSFLVIDQPSQVYFPSAQSGANQLDGDEDQLAAIRQERESDITATTRIFKGLARGLTRSQNKYQIIVLEHADNSIWGEVKNTHQVAAWKNRSDGLIPIEWI